MSLKAPSSRNTASFLGWIWHYKPLVEEETPFIEHSDDLVALSNRQESGWLDGFVEDVLLMCLPRVLLQKFLTSEEQLRKSNDKQMRLFSKPRIDLLVRLVLTVTTVALLVGPSAVLFLWPGHNLVKIVLIMLFTLLFSLALSAFTKARRHEMLAATAT